jgi:hypothetical protein
VPLALALVFSATLVGELVTVTVGPTPVTMNVKVVLPVVPSALVAVMVTVCVPTLSVGDSDQLQVPLRLPGALGVTEPSEAVSLVTFSSKSLYAPLAVAVLA